MPDLLMNSPPPREYQAQAEYTQDLIDRLTEAHDMLRHQQMDIRQEDSEEPPLFQSGDLVLMQNIRRRKGEAPKLQPMFVGPYEVVKAFKNHLFVGAVRTNYRTKRVPFKALQTVHRKGRTSTRNVGRDRLQDICQKQKEVN